MNTPTDIPKYIHKTQILTEIYTQKTRTVYILSTPIYKQKIHTKFIPIYCICTHVHIQIYVCMCTNALKAP